MFAVIASIALNDATFKSIAGATGDEWPDNDEYQIVTADSINITPFENNKDEIPKTGMGLRSSEIGLGWVFQPGSNINLATFNAKYFGTHSYAIACHSLLAEMIGNGEGRTIWGNEGYFEFGTRMARAQDVRSYVLENPATVYQANTAMLAWVAAYEGTYSSSANNYPPEKLDYGPSLTFGSTTIDVDMVDSSRGDPWFPGSAAITQYDLRYSTDGTNWTEVNDCGTTYQITGLSPSTLYFVQVRARNSHGIGHWSHNRWKNSADVTFQAMVTEGLITQSEKDNAPGGLNSTLFYDECAKVIVAAAGYENFAAAQLYAAGFTTV